MPRRVSGLQLENALFTSADGERWTRTDRGTGRYLVKSVAFDPRDPKITIAAAAARALYRSTDGGETWTASNAGLASRLDRGALCDAWRSRRVRARERGHVPSR